MNYGQSITKTWHIQKKHILFWLFGLAIYTYKCDYPTLRQVTLKT